jgi:DNA polymerase-3 subunit epsilon
MNASYDLTILDREARRYGVQPLTDVIDLAHLRVIDPRVLDKQLSRRRGKRTLTDLCAHYRVALDGAHDSTADAIAACRVAWRIGSQYPRIGGLDTHALTVAQAGWAAAQAESLAAYFRRTPGKESWADGVRTEWPLIPAPRTEGR